MPRGKGRPAARSQLGAERLEQPSWRGAACTQGSLRSACRDRVSQEAALRLQEDAGGGASTGGLPADSPPPPTPCPRDPVGRGSALPLPCSGILRDLPGGGRCLSPLVTDLVMEAFALAPTLTCERSHRWVAQPPGPKVGSACCSSSGENMGAGSTPRLACADCRPSPGTLRRPGLGHQHPRARVCI